MEQYTLLRVDALREFATSVLCYFGVPEDDARITVDVLITADQRGIYSHGLPRLGRYVDGLKAGSIEPVADIKILKETDNTLLVSGSNGLGQVIGYKVMKMVIDKARSNNIALAAVRDSNHYGIAGYYTMMALEHNLIGISTTNAPASVVPTFGRTGIIGTNPIAISAPAGRERAFTLDMATSTVPMGKIEVYEREGKKMPLTWVTDESAHPTQDASKAKQNILQRKGGGLLPLGGAGEENGGHKGYGLSLAMDIFSGVLSGGKFGSMLDRDPRKSNGFCHLFGAINIEAFISITLFQSMMDEYIYTLRNSEKAVGQNRIYIHGEKEAELYDKQKEQFLIHHKVVKELREIGEEINVKIPF